MGIEVDIIGEAGTSEMRRGLTVHRWGHGAPLVLLHGGLRRRVVRLRTILRFAKDSLSRGLSAGNNPVPSRSYCRAIPRAENRPSPSAAPG
jgi:hypothetical protein